MDTPAPGRTADSPGPAAPARLPATLGPELIRIPEALRISGISRASLYREQAAGRIVFRKYGRATLGDVASLRAFMAAMPTGTARP